MAGEGFDGGRPRWPRWLGGNSEGGALLGNTRAREVHWGLVNLGEWSAGGEHERGGELTAAAAMAGGAAGWRAEGEERAAFIGGLGPW
jgi:hypothetical protein